MTDRARMALAVPAAALLFGVAFSTPSGAQDSMQLDTMFRESLSQGRDFQAKREEESRRVQRRRYEGRDAKGAQEADRRDPKR
jgi:hypothetical protein